MPGLPGTAFLFCWFFGLRPAPEDYETQPTGFLWLGGLGFWVYGLEIALLSLFLCFAVTLLGLLEKRATSYRVQRNVYLRGLGFRV